MVEILPVLPALDLLAAPQTFDDLIMQIEARDCNMFFPMIGQPRAFMEIPYLTGKPDPYDPSKPGIGIERWVYRVFIWRARGTRSETEKFLCEATWKSFVDMRKQYATFFGDEAEPLIIWRRTPELQEIPQRSEFSPCFEHNEESCEKCVHGPITAINMRFAIPGLEIERHKHCTENPLYRSTESPMSPRFEVPILESGRG